MKTEINILNRPFVLEIIKGKLYYDNVEFEDAELGGLTNNDQRWIKIAGNISQSTRDDTIVHEITHNVCRFIVGNRFSGEEELICEVATNVVAVLKNNGFIPPKFTIPKEPKKK